MYKLYPVILFMIYSSCNRDLGEIDCSIPTPQGHLCNDFELWKKIVVGRPGGGISACVSLIYCISGVIIL